MLDAAAFFADYPRLSVVINHLGCPRLPSGDAVEATGTSEAALAIIADWRAGILALSALPNVYLKVSGLDFISPHWIAHPEARAVIKGMVS
jgi:predicted TIM-barrel fold metal-dependent hydrolase